MSQQTPAERNESQSQPIKIDVDAVIRTRLPRHYRFIPRFFIRWLSRTVCQDELNEMLQVCDGKRDADFCRGVIDHLGTSYHVSGEEHLPQSKRFIAVCNHPLGGLDGMMLIDFITRHYGPGVRFIVNDLLMAIEPLSGVFLPINKHGRQSREAFHAIDEAMEGSDPVIIFPAGLVSRKGKNGHIADLQWQKNFVNKAITHRRDIIPIFFSGHNSSFFYNFARLRTKLGLKLNIEMIRLPKEVFRSRGMSYKICIAPPISWQTLEGGAKAQSTADDIRRRVYEMESNQ